MDIARPVDPLARLREEYARHEEMCALLEQFAAELPDRADGETTRRLGSWLAHDIPLHGTIAEQALFPLLRSRAEPQDNIEYLLGQLAREHEIDSGYREEVLDQLAALSEGRPDAEPRMLASMLRAFSQMLQRHLAWARLVLLPLASRRLTAQDLERLSEGMRQHRFR